MSEQGMPQTESRRPLKRINVEDMDPIEGAWRRRQIEDSERKQQSDMDALNGRSLDE